jgi:hypothetical protein
MTFILGIRNVIPLLSRSILEEDEAARKLGGFVVWINYNLICPVLSINLIAAIFEK